MKTTQKPSTAPETPKAGSRLSNLFMGLAENRQPLGGRRSFFHILLQAALLLLLCASLLATLIFTVSTAMVSLTADRILSVGDLAEDVRGGEYDCILVLGAGVREDGSPSDMLRDRVSVACELYKSAEEGKIPLLMSGDHTGDYNEVGVMKKLAADMGVPTEDIYLDHEGYSTYESLYRAKHVFGAKKIVIITQEYHLHRALHIARELGMEAVGVSADLRPYRKQAVYGAREVLARFKDLFSAAKGEYDGHLDPPVDLNGDGNLT